MSNQDAGKETHSETTAEARETTALDEHGRISIECRCGRNHKVPHIRAGQKIHCPASRQELLVPGSMRIASNGTTTGRFFLLTVAVGIVLFVIAKIVEAIFPTNFGFRYEWAGIASRIALWFVCGAVYYMVMSPRSLVTVIIFGIIGAVIQDRYGRVVDIRYGFRAGFSFGWLWDVLLSYTVLSIALWSSFAGAKIAQYRLRRRQGHEDAQGTR